MLQLPAELLHLIVASVDRRTLYVLLSVSRQLHLIAEPLFYADVHFTHIARPHLLTRTITESLDNRIGRLVRRMTLPPSSFVDRYQDIYEPIRQRLPNLRYLDIGGGGYRRTPFAYREEFSFVEEITADYSLFARFIDSQPFVEQLTLSLWFEGPLHLLRESLQNLRALEVSLHSASSIVLRRHITHLRINSNAHNMNNARHWSHLLSVDREAFRNVVVFATDFVKTEVLQKLVARMPQLERLQLSVSSTSRAVDWLPKIATLPAPKLRHLRFDAPWRSYRDPVCDEDGARSALDVVPETLDPQPPLSHHPPARREYDTRASVPVLATPQHVPHTKGTILGFKKDDSMSCRVVVQGNGSVRRKGWCSARRIWAPHGEEFERSGEAYIGIERKATLTEAHELSIRLWREEVVSTNLPEGLPVGKGKFDELAFEYLGHRQIESPKEDFDGSIPHHEESRRSRLNQLPQFENATTACFIGTTANAEHVSLVVVSLRATRRRFVAPGFVWTKGPLGCSWVHSLSVTLSNRSLTRMEHKILAIIINILPSLRSFKYIDYSDNDDSVYHTAIDFHPPRHPLQTETSLRQFTCLNANILDQEPFLAFLHFHHGLQHLEFSEDVLNVPDLGKGILPNLETLRAPIDVILRLLPGRDIKRIKTTVSEDMAPVWVHMPRTAFATVQVFSSTVRGDAEELLESLVLQMSNLEFLEIEDENCISTSILRRTKIKFLRLRNLWGEFSARVVFNRVPALECIELQHTVELSVGVISLRWCRDVEKPYIISWDCNTKEEWLRDWRKDLFVRSDEEFEADDAPTLDDDEVL
ncbi:hypothetical protein EYR38_008297 [Pleurotus pulmonarius]|nr:hypothetical protein EYR38_008297 [Pleurotus pulmonarius]